MSRRKQKFPAHITSDGDALDDEEMENLHYSHNDESDIAVNYQKEDLSMLRSSLSMENQSAVNLTAETHTECNIEFVSTAAQSQDTAEEVTRVSNLTQRCIITNSPEASEVSPVNNDEPNDNCTHLPPDERESSSPVLRIVLSPVPPMELEQLPVIDGDVCSSDIEAITSDNGNTPFSAGVYNNDKTSFPWTSTNICNNSPLQLVYEVGNMCSSKAFNGIKSPVDMTNPNNLLGQNSAVLLLPQTTKSGNGGIENNLFREVNRPYEGEAKKLNSEKLPSKIVEPLICPVCKENFRSKRAFNSHILIHCQLVKSPHLVKRSADEAAFVASSEKRRTRAGSPPNALLTSDDSTSSFDCESSLPLDLSCRRSSTEGEAPYSLPPQWPATASFDEPGSTENIYFPDRCPLEDENENLVNEGREHERAFFDNSQNKLYLTEDSSGLDPPPPLPLFHAGGVTKRIKVCSDEGSPMVYRIKTHSEQIFVSRILGVNEETGDKIELFKCFMCSLSFPSVSRLQAHLSNHRQRFVCRKCNYSCDSRVQFSHHVQREHQNKEYTREKVFPRGSADESTSAENTVTVAALLSALREKSLESHKATNEQRSLWSQEDDENIKTETFDPISPDNHDIMEDTDLTSGSDIFKTYTCRFCHKKFDRAFSCNRHERVHTGYKPCFCRICGRGFSEPRNLRHHVIRFHSDGSLRHLIKRDRRKRKEDDSPPEMSQTVPAKDVLKESGNKDISVGRINQDFMTSQHRHLGWENDEKDAMIPRAEDINSYTTSLTKMFAATLDSTSRYNQSEANNLLLSPRSATGRDHAENDPMVQPLIDSDSYVDVLEPGEIRLNLKTKIVEDASGRRMMVSDDHSENSLDHSPQFSSYAPRLNIVQEPINRDKALRPITDDIGRTFYECPYCHKLFGSTSDLNRHLDFHEDLRPYNCEYCDYSARTNSQLKVHKMRHEGIKQFSCDICNYNGVTQSDLNRHKKTQSHISRSQNICTFCGLGFYSGSQKQVHILQCHPEFEGASSLLQMSMGSPAAFGTTKESSSTQ